MPTLTKDQMRHNVAANFKHIRSDLEMTSTKMANTLGLSQKTYAAIEEGRALNPHHVYLMSRYTGITIDTLLTRQIKL